jgi:hypothetical protein
MQTFPGPHARQNVYHEDTRTLRASGSYKTSVTQRVPGAFVVKAEGIGTRATGCWLPA